MHTWHWTHEHRGSNRTHIACVLFFLVLPFHVLCLLSMSESRLTNHPSVPHHIAPPDVLMATDASSHNGVADSCLSPSLQNTFQDLDANMDMDIDDATNMHVKLSLELVNASKKEVHDESDHSLTLSQSQLAAQLYSDIPSHSQIFSYPSSSFHDDSVTSNSDINSLKPRRISPKWSCVSDLPASDWPDGLMQDEIIHPIATSMSHSPHRLPPPSTVPTSQASCDANMPFNSSTHNSSPPVSHSLNSTSSSTASSEYVAAAHSNPSASSHPVPLPTPASQLSPHSPHLSASLGNAIPLSPAPFAASTVSQNASAHDSGNSSTISPSQSLASSKAVAGAPTSSPLKVLFVFDHPIPSSTEMKAEVKKHPCLHDYDVSQHEFHCDYCGGQIFNKKTNAFRKQQDLSLSVTKLHRLRENALRKHCEKYHTQSTVRKGLNAASFDPQCVIHFTSQTRGSASPQPSRTPPSLPSLSSPQLVSYQNAPPNHEATISSPLSHPNIAEQDENSAAAYLHLPNTPLVHAPPHSTPSPLSLPMSSLDHQAAYEAFQLKSPTSTSVSMTMLLDSPRASDAPQCTQMSTVAKASNDSQISQALSPHSNTTPTRDEAQAGTIDEECQVDPAVAIPSDDAAAAEFWTHVVTQKHLRRIIHHVFAEIGVSTELLESDERSKTAGLQLASTHQPALHDDDSQCWESTSQAVKWQGHVVPAVRSVFRCPFSITKRIISELHLRSPSCLRVFAWALIDSTRVGYTTKLYALEILATAVQNDPLQLPCLPKIFKIAMSSPPKFPDDATLFLYILQQCLDTCQHSPVLSRAEVDSALHYAIEAFHQFPNAVGVCFYGSATVMSALRAKVSVGAPADTLSPMQHLGPVIPYMVS